MRLERHSRRMARPRLMFLLLGGVAVGVLGGLQVGNMIERAGAGGMFGGTLLPPVEFRSEKPSEEDRQMRAALAAATGVDDHSDCQSLAPRHQAGCRAYLQDRARREDIFDSFVPQQAGNLVSPASSGPGSSSATDWPAAFD